VQGCATPLSANPLGGDSVNWEAIGAVGEILGAIAVLITLVYLATQIRQNTAQQRREELVSIQHGQNAVVAQLQDPRVLGAYVRTAEDRSPTIQDRGTAFSWIVQYLNHFWLVHELHRNGALDEEQYQLWTGFAVAIVAPKGVRRWWDEENGRLGFRAEVRDLIDSRLRDSENPPLPITEMWSQFSGDAWEQARFERD
jgi:hypothetical protein